ncbi:MAG: response regulator [Candidatus Heimdallarchaeota archaeon]
MEKLLVVDDNEDLRSMFSFMLNQYEVIQASNGIEAVKLFEEQQPKLVLMDIIMPEMDGIEATRRIITSNPNALILAITAFSTRAGEMLSVGAQDVILKPVRKRQLLKMIEDLLSKASAS